MTVEMHLLLFAHLTNQQLLVGIDGEKEWNVISLDARRALYPGE